MIFKKPDTKITKTTKIDTTGITTYHFKVDILLVGILSNCSDKLLIFTNIKNGNNIPNIHSKYSPIFGNIGNKNTGISNINRYKILGKYPTLLAVKVNNALLASAGNNESAINLNILSKLLKL